MSPAISDAFAHMDETSALEFESSEPPQYENELQLGFTVTQMADRVEALLKSIGLVDHFSPIVYILAHGSSSANNPHHGAHDCGACSGRPGSVNARIFSLMANHSEVRNLLSVRGIRIPEQTCFIGGMHDTAADEIRFFDVEKLNWLNGQWIKALSPAELLNTLLAWKADRKMLEDIAAAIQPRINLLSEAVNWAGFYFNQFPQVSKKQF